MGTMRRLFRRIAGEPDTLRHKRPRGRPGNAACHASCISSSWLQSVRSLGQSGELSPGGVIVPVPALSPSIMTSIWFRTEQSSNDESRRGRPLPPLSSSIFYAQALRGGM